MSVAKAGKFIFRRIRGRLVRIKVKKVNLSARAKDSYSNKYPTIKFNTKKTVGTIRGTRQSIGRAMVFKDKNVLAIGNVSVNKEFRNQGIGSALFRKIVNYASKTKISKIDGTVVVPSQLKIRSKYPTKFFVGDRAHGHQVKYKEALKYLNNSQVIDAVTDVDKIRRNRKITKALVLGGAGTAAAAYKYGQK